jgi:predicted dehydrogenase
MDRRTFFLSGGAAAMAAASPSEQLVVGVIGSGGRGRLLTRVFLRDPAIRIGAVCDVYEPNLEAGLSVAGGQARALRNYKALLERTDIDIVIIATPEHWHHRMLLDALAAGKDVFVEKPLCQTPSQGVELVEAAARSKSIVQVGMQRRSYDLYLEARRVVAAGTLGSVRMVRSWWLNNQLQPNTRKLGGPLDWEQWQGPAPRRPLDAARFFGWRSYSDYAGGIVGDQGAHVFDGIHMLMGATFPQAVNASAGRVHKPGVDTPEGVVVAAEYPEDFLGVFTINYAAMRYQRRNDQLNQLDGDRARMDVGREGYFVYRQGEEETPALQGSSATGFGKATETHVDNFLECVRTRKTPTAPVALGFQAALVTQMANLSVRLGRRVRWNPKRKKVET